VDNLEGTTSYRKALSGKRHFSGKHSIAPDSPAYDASEEDNDPLTDDNASGASIPAIARVNAGRSSNLNAATSSSRFRHPVTAENAIDSGVESPMYDGDVESSATAGPDLRYHTSKPSVDSTLTSPVASTFLAEPTVITQPGSVTTLGLDQVELRPVPVLETQFDPYSLTPEAVQDFIMNVMMSPNHAYKITPPPVGRPVRVYADGVYDIFHFGHALQLKQAKLSFPLVHLLVGVNSDEDVRVHKAATVMLHAERCESLRHCRWVDEVVEEAPWVIDQQFLDRWQIDYVAHDDDPYASSGMDDVYSYCKSRGKFIPTRRTPGVSTSDLLERIVSGYRKRDWDAKLEKMGHPELMAVRSDGSAHENSV